MNFGWRIEAETVTSSGHFPAPALCGLTRRTAWFWVLGRFALAGMATCGALLFPLAARAESDEGRAPAVLNFMEEYPPPKRIALIAALPTRMQAWSDFLTRLGYQVSIVEAKRAVDAVAQDRPDVILVDDDAERTLGVFKQLHADRRTRNIPVIVVGSAPLPERRL